MLKPSIRSKWISVYPENFMNQVGVGQDIRVAHDALLGRSYNSNVIAVNSPVDAGRPAIAGGAQVRNQNTLLYPGMFARVTLITRSRKDTLVPPEKALVPQGTGQCVSRNRRMRKDPRSGRHFTLRVAVIRLPKTNQKKVG
jgi:multidrug efflux pump subunit AcrA (membrane-fusion protein)